MSTNITWYRLITAMNGEERKLKCLILNKHGFSLKKKNLNETFSPV